MTARSLFSKLDIIFKCCGIFRTFLLGGVILGTPPPNPQTISFKSIQIKTKKFNKLNKLNNYLRIKYLCILYKYGGLHYNIKVSSE